MMAKRLTISNSQSHICTLLSCAAKLGEGAKQRRGLPWSRSRRVEELWRLQLRIAPEHDMSLAPSTEVVDDALWEHPSSLEPPQRFM